MGVERTAGNPKQGSGIDELTFSLCILCHNRPVELLEALGSVSHEAWHEIIVLDMASNPAIPQSAGTIWLRSDRNLGVAGGRNKLVTAATGEILVFLDDDAVLRSAICGPLSRQFANEPTLGAVAFRIHRPAGTELKHERPFRGSRGTDHDVTQDCAYFVGCGYAIRRVAHLAVGGYDERFFYSTEEIDLAFRLIGQGWRLRYVPAINVEHRPSPRGRDDASGVPAWRIRNRLLLVRAHLPAMLAIFHGACWAIRTGREAQREHSLKQWWRMAKEGFTFPVVRKPLKWSTLVRTQRLGGRVLY